MAKSDKPFNTLRGTWGHPLKSAHPRLFRQLKCACERRSTAVAELRKQIERRDWLTWAVEFMRRDYGSTKKSRFTVHTMSRGLCGGGRHGPSMESSGAQDLNVLRSLDAVSVNRFASASGTRTAGTRSFSADQVLRTFTRRPRHPFATSSNLCGVTFLRSTGK